MASDTVFKFVSLRPPRTLNRPQATKLFAQHKEVNTSFLKKLPTIKEIEELENFVNEHINIKNHKDIAIQLHDLVKVASTSKKVNEAKASIKEKVNTDLDKYLKLKQVTQTSLALWDATYAHAVYPDKFTEDWEYIYRGIQSIHYLEMLQKMKASDMPISYKIFEKIKPTIDPKLLPSLLIENSRVDDNVNKEQVKKLKELYSDLKYMDDSIDDIKNIGELYKNKELRKIAIPNAEASIIGSGIIKNYNLTNIVGPVKVIEAKMISASIVKKADIPVDIESETETIPSKKPWLLDSFGEKNLKADTKKLLAGYSNEFAEKHDLEVINNLKFKMADKTKNFFYSVPKASMVALAAQPEFKWITEKVPLPIGGITLKPYIPPFRLPDRTPETRGIKPLGIGDLLVVEQELVKYVAGEVAHIENIMGSEHKKRVHSRLTESEEIIVEESEIEEESERDLQTTERFELQKESQQTIESDMKVHAGASVTASYGVVTASVTGDFSFSESTSETNKSASNYAKEIVNRSVARYREKMRTERTRRSLERIEELNEHGFDNTKNTDHVIGIYRWVDKFYNARLINYGKRLMFEFIIPEPAAFYIHTQEGKQLEGVTLKKPEKPTIYGNPLAPHHLTKFNYTDFISKYNVQDVDPYPEEIVRVSAAIAEAPGAGGDKNVDIAGTSDKLKVPDGYRAFDVYGSKSTSGIKDSGYFLSVKIGGQKWGSITAYGIEDIIPISVSGWATAYQVNVVAKCELKSETIRKWQLKTYQAIMNAYENELAAYNDQVTAAQIQQGVNIQGKNPLFNEKIEKEELRKGALRLLTDDFKKIGLEGNWLLNEPFNAMYDFGEFGYPEFNTDEALKEGKVIQFFEQAFEWNNMTYRYYPYFWGRKQDWDETYTKEDTDPNFTDFLRAGAARVVVPVYPTYNETILFYLKTNKIWNGTTPPALNDPLYISIIEEIRAENEYITGEQLPACDLESGYPCLADEWEVKVPTNLTYLQKESDLPDLSGEGDE